MNHAVVLAGGGGTRLWPASRRRTPKQLLALGKVAGETLLAATCRRLASVVGPGCLWIVTAADQAEAVAEAVPNLARDRILAEPCARNTAAAIGLAAVHIAAVDDSAVLAVVPADQTIGDEAMYQDVLRRAFAIADAQDAIVTIGIRPTGPETGFGYLEPGSPATPDGARPVVRFVEKPDRATAESYVAAGYLWNGGTFFFRARRILAELMRHLPGLGDGLAEIARTVTASGDFAAETARIYPHLPAISIDYGVMERARGILVVEGDFGWNDVGSWGALADVRPADADGNVAAGPLVAVDAHGNVVSTDSGMVALVGVTGLVVVRAGNAVLVVPRERAQDVRDIVKQLERTGQEEYL
jgi:mannose-1-phosphate guanylyltransferase